MAQILPRAWLHRASEPQVLFPLLTALVVVVIWGLTLTYLRSQHSDAERTARASTREILSTYEARTVRAIDQIDKTLDLIVWLHDEHRAMPSLEQLQANDLLPPTLVFIVSIADREGRVLDSTRPKPPPSIAGRDYFELQKKPNQGVVVGQPITDSTGAAQRLNFSRRLEGPDGSFDGIVVVVVDAAYFVSGYEQAKLGERGLLALLGADGRVRVARSGEHHSAGGTVDYQALSAIDQDGDSPVLTVRNDWDGEERWIAARPVYGVPLAVMVGLSVEEQLAAVDRGSRPFLWFAGAGSLLAIVFLGALGRQSWLLARSRAREQEIRQAHAERVEYLAYHDGLTDLPNRTLFSRLLEQGIAEAQRYDHMLALAYVDLDRFKSINDSFGHEAGDQLLKEVARRLLGCVRAADTVARLGGDEFVVLLPRVRGEPDVASVARKIVDSLAEPFVLQGRSVRISASVGIGLSPRDGVEEGVLKRHADLAMYTVKARGRNGYQFYRGDTMQTGAFRRLK